uniref:Secreted protein n=1 Tax=Steinernema glaseri TaxID=37863 RepID=A0A1I7ZK60_9BILA
MEILDHVPIFLSLFCKYDHCINAICAQCDDSSCPPLIALFHASQYPFSQWAAPSHKCRKRDKNLGSLVFDLLADTYISLGSPVSSSSLPCDLSALRSTFRYHKLSSSVFVRKGKHKLCMMVVKPVCSEDSN